MDSKIELDSPDRIARLRMRSQLSIRDFEKAIEIEKRIIEEECQAALKELQKLKCAQ